MRAATGLAAAQLGAADTMMMLAGERSSFRSSEILGGRLLVL